MIERDPADEESDGGARFGGYDLNTRAQPSRHPRAVILMQTLAPTIARSNCMRTEIARFHACDGQESVPTRAERIVAAHERRHRFATGLFLGLSGIFVLATIYIIARAAVYMPYLDQWGWLRRYYSDSDSLASLAFTPINGHILAVPALLYTADIVLAHASNVINLTGLVSCAIGTCLLLRAGFAAPPANRSMTNLFFAASLVLMFWFHSWENLFWPFQVHGYVAAMLAAAGLFVLSTAELAGERPDAKVAIVGVALGVLATLSFGVGLSFWPAAMAMVLLGRWRPGWKLAAAGLAAGIAAPVLYWIMHFSRGGQSIQRATAVDALGALKFVSLYLGSPLYFGGNERVLEQSTPALALALGAGYAGLAFACLAVYRLARARSNGELTRGRMFFAGLMIFALWTRSAPPARVPEEHWRLRPCRRDMGLFACCSGWPSPRCICLPRMRSANA